MKDALVMLACCAFGLSAADVHIPIEKFQLKNGLRVIVSADHAVPVVAVYVIYDVGARAEQKGRTGFAHLFEHMMFEGSKNAPKGMHDRIVESNGGVLNGSTHPDYTDYFETMPANKLAAALWLESDRMRNLDISEENLKNQKEAVKQERRLSFDNRPYATAIVDVWPTLAYKNWSNSHSLIGSYEDLNAASVEDVRSFFRTYYAPDNAVLVIAGDVQTPEVKKLVETYFADIPSQPKPNKPDLTEPAATAKMETYKDGLARVPQVLIGYPGPPRRSVDYYALGMLDAVITGGESSRFNLDLVKGKASIISFEAQLGWPFAQVTDYKDPEVYAMALMYKPNFTGKQIVEQAQEELDRIAKEGVPEAELQRVRSYVRAARIQQLQTALSRAQLLGQYEILDGKPELINSEMDQFLGVTGAQIQAVAKKYLRPEVRTVLDIVPNATKPPKGGAQ